MIALIARAFGAATGIAMPYLTYILGGAFIALLAGAGLLYWQWTSAEERADQLRIENDRQQSVITGLQAKIVFQSNAIGALESVGADLSERDKSSDQIKQDIGNAPPSDDAPVAPVLDRVLDGLERLRQPDPKN